MIFHKLVLVALLLLPTGAVLGDEPLPPIPPITRLLPPEGIKLPEDVREELAARLKDVEAQTTAAFKSKPLWDRSERARIRDILIFTDAVAMALRNGEFYNEKKDVAKAHALLDEAQLRIVEWHRYKHSWTTSRQLVVRGFESYLDSSTQPYGIVYPKDFDPKGKKKYPVYVWLHGRGDQATNLHFLHERMTQVGQLGEVDGIVLHPFGRQCVGFKGPGMMDVIECYTRFLIDADREDEPLPVDFDHLVLIGFSMGGAGAWQVGAHRAFQFVAISPGAGFAETVRYTNTDPKSVPWYQQKLWGYNDVPAYTRNLFNTQVIAYSGENDKQIQAARVMEEAFRAEGRELTHLIGPGVGHQYEPKTLVELKQLLATICQQPRDDYPREVHLQTRTLSFAVMHWIVLHALERHWEDTRVDAQLNENKSEAAITTKNVTRLEIKTPPFRKCVIDGTSLDLPGTAKQKGCLLEKKEGKWLIVDAPWRDLHKDLLCHGPIDDAFNSQFIVVTPTGKSKNPLVQRWVEFELEHFLERWRTLMRGEVQQKKDSEITEKDIAYYNLVCFGDPDSNSLIRRAAEKLPVTWKDDQIVVGDQKFTAASHLPALVYPNPLQSEPTNVDDFPVRKYLVVNSGLTFREAHDKTNSQQNPKLPDWAVIDLRQLPDDKSPGKVAAAGFFDEQWQLQKENSR